MTNDVLFIQGASPAKKSEESTSVTPERNASQKVPDNVVPEHTPQHVIARVHQLLEVRFALVPVLVEARRFKHLHLISDKQC